MRAGGLIEQTRTNPFVYDASDLRALNWQATRWWQLLLSISLAVALMSFFGSLMVEEGFDWILAGVMLLILVLAAGTWTWRPILVRWSLKRQGLLEPMTIELSPDLIIVRTAKTDARTKWSGVTRVERTADRLFLFSSKSVARIVPRRAFDSDDQFEAFAIAARDRWEQSHRL